MQLGREQGEKAGIAAKCEFVTSFASPVEAIVSLDSFEHFAEAGAVLQTMYSLLDPRGCAFAFVSFVPPGYHPFGRPTFSRSFPGPTLS